MKSTSSCLHHTFIIIVGTIKFYWNQALLIITKSELSKTIIAESINFTICCPNKCVIPSSSNLSNCLIIIISTIEFCWGISISSIVKPKLTITIISESVNIIIFSYNKGMGSSGNYLNNFLIAIMRTIYFCWNNFP